ncbi:MAG: thiamine phosphate synthase [Robiginitomaculum sp.]|nr:thiamine phosphate synthase [Robiginitomaculum sp.]MDQ7076248.1 thiamine phosphate synthase [Robiginitomaculum sp.]
MRIEPCRLYLLTPPRLDDLGTFAKDLEVTLAAGDVAALQIRLKDVSDAEIRDAYQTLAPIAHGADVAVLINDRVDLARELGADGVHLGQDDMPLREARKILGPQAMIGATAHNSRHLAMLAGESGADYVAFGAFFESATKTPKTQATTDLLSWWSELFEIPCVAIGGITVDNCAPLVQAGADFLAVCGGVWNAPDGPDEAVRAFNAAIQKASLAA